MVQKAFKPLKGESWLRSDDKRQMDVILARPLLMVSAPLLWGARLAIRYVDGFDPNFQQLRGGKEGEEIEIHKLRTMSPTAEITIGHGKSDRRASALGRFLRKTHIDELPQLHDVIRGNMSLAGPRPIIAAAQEEVMDNLSPYEQKDWLWARRVAKPGFADPYAVRLYTGQKCGGPRERAGSDIAYAATATFGGDIAILSKAALVGLCAANNVYVRSEQAIGIAEPQFAKHSYS